MVENISFNSQDLFERIVEQGIREGVADQEAYDHLVETIVQEELNVGEMHDDMNLEGIEDKMRGRWEEYKQRFESREA